MMPQTKENRPKVGLAVIACREGKILLGKRLGTQPNTWCFPGGHMEYGESFEQTARRETLEEAGLELENLRYLHTTNDVYPDRHYITVFMVADANVGEPDVREPDKTIEWGWYDWDAMPQPLFQPIINLMEAGVRPDLV